MQKQYANSVIIEVQTQNNMQTIRKLGLWRSPKVKEIWWRVSHKHVVDSLVNVGQTIREASYLAKAVNLKVNAASMDLTFPSHKLEAEVLPGKIQRPPHSLACIYQWRWQWTCIMRGCCKCLHSAKLRTHSPHWSASLEKGAARPHLWCPRQLVH